MSYTHLFLFFFIGIAGFTPDWNEGRFLCVGFGFFWFFSGSTCLILKLVEGKKTKEITENQRLDSQVVFNCENHKRKDHFIKIIEFPHEN